MYITTSPENSIFITLTNVVRGSSTLMAAIVQKNAPGVYMKRKIPEKKQDGTENFGRSIDGENSNCFNGSWSFLLTSVNGK